MYWILNLKSLDSTNSNITRIVLKYKCKRNILFLKRYFNPSITFLYQKVFQMCFNCKLQGYLLKLIGIITSCNSEWHIKESEGMFVTWLDEAKRDKKIAKQSAKPIILWRKVKHPWKESYTIVKITYYG